MKIVFDTNIWISFAIGKRLSYLEQVLLNRRIKVFVSSELILEFYHIASSSKLSKYLSEERIADTIQLIKATSEVTSFIKRLLNHETLKTIIYLIYRYRFMLITSYVTTGNVTAFLKLYLIIGVF